MNLSLKLIQDSGLGRHLNEKEAMRTIQEKLDEQKKLLEKPVEKEVHDLDSIIVKGGKYDYRFGGKKYKISVLTPSNMHIMNNIDNFTEQGISYNIPPMYKFHLTTALGNKLFVQAKTHSEAQAVADAIFGKGCYCISASKI
jgi:hypothetical protein